MKIKLGLLIVAVTLLSACSSSESPVAPSIVKNRVLDAALFELNRQYIANGAISNNNAAAVGLKLLTGSRIALTVTTNGGDISAIITLLEAAGMTNVAHYKHLISGVVPIKDLDKLSGINGISWVSSHRGTSYSVGLASNKGEIGMRADVVKVEHNLNGEGITIGVLSDSYNCLGGAASDVTSGDLPSDVRVIKEYSFCAEDPTVDEGRAMMQLIHDIAPAAKLIFYTAWEGPVGFAQGIISLADNGADIIVDDIGYLTMPMFQEGPIAQAVNDVTARGVAYFSAAGNSARKSYESTAVFPGAGEQAHDFGLAAGQASDLYQKIIVPKNSTIKIAFQWASPYEIATGQVGADSDLNIYLYNADKSNFVASSTNTNINHNPVEFLTYTTASDSENYTFYLHVRYMAGEKPTKLKYVLFGSGSMDYDTQSSTVFGHANASGTIAVGAMSYQRAPLFDNSLLIEDFSSAGGTPILYDGQGRLLAAPEYHPNPAFIALDDIDTTFFPAVSAALDTDNTGLPNFKGTSAAAPNAAAVAALLLQKHPYLGPGQVKQVMMQGTIKLTEPVNTSNDPLLGFSPCAANTTFGWATGCGLIQADKILDAVAYIPIDSDFGDFNGNACIDETDKSMLFAAFRLGLKDSAYDLSGDGKLDESDLTVMDNLLLSNAACS